MKAEMKISKMLMVLVFIATIASCAAQSAVSKEKGMGEAQETVEGMITFIEPDATLIVKDNAGNSHVIYLRQESKIFSKGSEIHFGDLKTGDMVSATVDSMKSAMVVQVLAQDK